MYACTIAIPISKKVNTKRTPKGKRFTSKKISPTIIILQLKPINTLKRVCPAIILAKRRTARLTKRNVYEMSSIGTNKNNKGKAIPDGRNKLNK
jgi:hypothetical protein